MNNKLTDVCSPYSYIHADKFTCLTNENISLLKEEWNKRHPNNKINSNDPREIWEEMNTYMKHYLCENERCWVRKLISNSDIKRDIFSESFAPSMPHHWKKKPNAWLSDIDISRVMRQFEVAHSDFLFIGPSPIDYDVYDEDKNQYVWPELKDFNLTDYLNKTPPKSRIGIVFNLDDHKGVGTHWVAMFIHITDRKIYYFDSNGNTIPANIKRLVDRIKSQGKKHNMNFTLSCNYPNEHQKKNTECGVYVLFFLKTMLNENNWKLFKNDRISDEEIHKQRAIFYNTV